jgi:ssDNA-binding Zn-finger/Zn-ribbon topoisomerase 1
MSEDVKCPICGSETVERTAKKGPNAGSSFHVCNLYPECKGKAEIKGLVSLHRIPVFNMLEQAFTEVYTGQLDPKRATAMAALARSMVAVLSSGDLEERLRNLEVKVKESEVVPQEFDYQHEGKYGRDNF